MKIYYIEVDRKGGWVRRIYVNNLLLLNTFECVTWDQSFKENI